MPYPRTCPCCSFSFPDDRSHVSLRSQLWQGRRVLQLLCLSCRGTFDWDFSGAQVFVERPLPEVEGGPVGGYGRSAG